MKISIKFTISALLSTISLCALAKPNNYQFITWQPMGNPGFSSQVSNQQVVVNAGNKIYAAIQNGEYTNTESIMTVSNGTWVPAGNAQFATNIYSGSLAINSYSKTATPYFAYTSQDNLSGGQVIVDHLIANKIEQVGTAVSTSGASGTHALAISSDGVPYIFYYDMNTHKGSVKKFANGQWTNVGSEIPVDYTGNGLYEQAAHLSILVAKNGQLFVSWRVHLQLTIETLKDGQWVQDGTKLNMSPLSDFSKLAVSPTGKLFYAKISDSNYRYPTLYQLTKNGTWEILKRFTGYVGDFGDQALSFSQNGNLYYAFIAEALSGSSPDKPDAKTEGIHVFALSQNQHWVAIGDQQGNGESQFLSLASDFKNQPFLSYVSNLGQAEVKTLSS